MGYKVQLEVVLDGDMDTEKLAKLAATYNVEVKFVELSPNGHNEFEFEAKQLKHLFNYILNEYSAGDLEDALFHMTTVEEV